jgi:CBS-domain-containing membrane protein
MKKNESVQKIMTKELITINKITPYADLVGIFDNNPFHHIPVVEGEKIIGIITTNDMLKAKFSEKIFGDSRNATAVLEHTLTIDDIMTKKPETITCKTTIRDASELLKQRPFNALPVVDEDNKLLGLVTTKDLVKFLFSKY